MAFQPVPDAAQITVVFVQNGEDIVNTANAELLGGYNLVDIAALASAVDSEMSISFLPQMTLDAAYLRTEVRGLAVQNDLLVIESAFAGPGLITSKGLPNSVTLSIKKSSPFTGRSARGRWYWIGMQAAALTSDENVYIDAEATARVSAVENLRQAINATVWTAVIVSRFSNGVQRPFGETFDWVATSKVDNRVDTQRGRLG